MGEISACRRGASQSAIMSEETAQQPPRVYTPRVFSSIRRDHTKSEHREPQVKKDVVFHVDKKDTWRKIDVCPCFKEESFYPQVVTLFDCLNRNFGERSECAAEQTAVDMAIMADIKAKQNSSKAV